MIATSAAGMAGTGARAVRFDRRLVAAVALVAASWKWPLAGAAVVGVIDLLWARAAGLTFTGFGSGFNLIASILLLGLIWQTGGILLAQRQGASHWSRQLQRLGHGAGYWGLWCILGSGMVLLSYLCATFAQPFQDGIFAALDHSLGFDWPVWAHFVEHSPPLKPVLSYAYHSHGAQLILIFFVAAFSGDDRRAAEFLWISTLGLIVACAVSAWLPAIGPKVYFGLGTSVWVPDVMRLRMGGPAVFDQDHIKGIISMPSYHAALAVFLMWSSRRTGIIGLGFIVFNLTMIVSTLSGGGHYLVDVIAGLTLAAASIAIVHPLVYRDLTPARRHAGSAGQSGLEVRP